MSHRTVAGWPRPACLAPWCAAAKEATPRRGRRGDPQPSGVYSNDDETACRSSGRRSSRTLIEDITAQELVVPNKQRNEQFNAGVAGTEFAGGIRPPTHPSSIRSSATTAAWLVVDPPPDGKVPPLTAEVRAGTSRPLAWAAAWAVTQSGRPFDSYEDLGLYDRCITRGILADDARRIWQLRDHSGQGLGGPALREIHEHRVVPFDRGERRPHIGKDLHLISATREAGMTAARPWSRRRISRPERLSRGERHLKMTERFTPVAEGIVGWKVTSTIRIPDAP
jgi:hypothetical protein